MFDKWLRGPSGAAEKFCDDMQRGFLSGRLMGKNIMELDADILLGRLRDVEGCTLLFDFEAAFPSLAHDFMWDVLDSL